jgi:hypothetical protein
LRRAIRCQEKQDYEAANQGHHDCDTFVSLKPKALRIKTTAAPKNSPKTKPNAKTKLLLGDVGRND